MKTSLTLSLKTLVMVCAVVFTLTQGVARADEILISLTTSGGLSPTAPPGFTFEGATFSGLVEANGAREFNFGTIRIAYDPNVNPTDFLNRFNGQQFTLNITFTAPSGIAGNPSPYTVSPPITGTIDTSGGLLVIDFAPVTPFNFANSSTIGSFDLLINPVVIDPSSHQIQATITGGVGNVQFHPVPEPATIFLLATGLAGAAGAARRRLRRGPQ